MTTPAKNIHQITSRPGYLTSQNFDASGDVGPPQRSVLRNVNERWTDEVRPASGSVPFDSRFGWRSCRAWNHSGRGFFYPPNRVVRTIKNGPIGVRQIYDDGSFWGVSPPVGPTFPSGLINRAEIQALNKLKQQDINLGAFMAEFGKTSQMIGNHIAQIARTVRQWRRGNPKLLWQKVRENERGGVGRRLVDKIPNSWLELQYGWNPLLSDIYGAIQFLGRPERDPFIHVKGYAERVSSVPVLVNPVAGTSSCVMEVECKEQAWVSLYYLLNNPGLATQSSLGLLNVAEIIWECLPYSFILDWVIPIGPWMSSLTADAGFTFKGGSRSTSTKLYDARVRSVNLEAISGVNSVVVEGGGPDLQGSSYNFARTCYTSSPVPGLYVKNPLSALHVTNAIALLLQAFR